VNRSNFDLLICGGGVIGLSVAYLAAKLRLTVAVCDQSAIGREASWAGAGILPPPATKNIDDPIDQLRNISHSIHEQWAYELQQLTQTDNGFRRCGGIYVASTPGEVATLRANENWWADHGIEFSRLSSNELQKLEPHLAVDAIHGQTSWLLPGECQIRNPRHLKALRTACEMMGVRFFENASADQFEYRNQELSAVNLNGCRVSAAHFCFATGAWSRAVLAEFGSTLEVFPVRGQMVLYNSNAIELNRIVNEGNRYMVPRDDGRILVGSSEEEVGFAKNTTDPIIQDLRQWASRWLPELHFANVEQTWAGLRPASIDGMPYIGKIPQLQNCYVATGHFRHGLHLSTGTAKIICCLIKNEPLPMNVEPFRTVRGNTSGHAETFL
jgi:glycine oxidase